MDAITMLKDEHKRVEKLFKQFDKAGDNANKTRRDVMDRIIKELSVHAAVEEIVFYPAVRAALDGTDQDDACDMVLESLEEHHVVKWLLDELDGMDPEHERFVPKATVLMENVRHHVEEEEQDLFPAVREVLKRNALVELGESMAEARGMVPTKPHPRAPDTPPGNVIVGIGNKAIDRAREAGREAIANAGRKVKAAATR